MADRNENGMYTFNKNQGAMEDVKFDGALYDIGCDDDELIENLFTQQSPQQNSPRFNETVDPNATFGGNVSQRQKFESHVASGSPKIHYTQEQADEEIERIKVTPAAKDQDHNVWHYTAKRRIVPKLPQVQVTPGKPPTGKE